MLARRLSGRCVDGLILVRAFIRPAVWRTLPVTVLPAPAAAAIILPAVLQTLPTLPSAAIILPAVLRTLPTLPAVPTAAFILAPLPSAP